MELFATSKTSAQHERYRNGYSTDESLNSLDTDDISSRKSKRLKLIAEENVRPSHLQQRDRRPTRVPDPNTFNRNALMARENRRKKKVYLANLEKEVKDVRRTNQILNQKLLQQTKVIANLKDEQKYFKNILRNKKEIMSICDTLSLPSPLQQIESDLNDNDSTPEHPFNTPDTSPNYYENDYNYSPNYLSDICAFDDVPSLHDDNWETLLDYNSTNCSEFSSASPHNIKVESICSSIISDHNYSSSNDCTPQYENDDEEDMGTCAHVVAGKRISIEFCSQCNINALTVNSRISPKIEMIDDGDQLDVVNF